MKQLANHRLWLILFMLIALGLRFVGTDRIPAGISHDELDYYLGGKFIALTGSDMTGTWKWWSLSPMRTGTITAETAALFYVPLGLLPSNLQTAKLTPAVIGSLMVPVMFGLLTMLSRGNMTLGLAGAGLMAINPWHVVYSRTGFEVTLALFAYAGALVFFWGSGYFKKKRHYAVLLVVLSLVFLALGYYSYHGFKPIAPFIALGMTFGLNTMINKGTRSKTWIVIALSPLILSIILLLGTLMSAHTLGERRGELIVFSPQLLSEAVDRQRRLSTLPFLAQFMENKYTLMGRHMASTYLGFFSLDRLFFSAEDGYNLRFSVHGYFYAFEILLVTLGGFLAIKKRHYWLLVGLLIVAPLPSALHVGQSYGIRSMLAILPLVCFSALGFVWLWEKAKSKWWRIGIMSVLLVSVFNVWYMYVGNFGVVSADQYMINHRLLSSYVSRLPPDVPVLIVAPEPYQVFRQLLFYGDLIDRENVFALQDQFMRQGIYDDYEFEQVVVTRNCRVLQEFDRGVLIIDGVYEETCILSNAGKPEISLGGPVVALGSPIDSRAYYRVYGDRVCDNRVLPGYIHVSDIHSLAVEKLSLDDFCATWSFRAL